MFVTQGFVSVIKLDVPPKHTLSFFLAFCNIINVSVADSPALQDVFVSYLNMATCQANREQMSITTT
jgi:hypothetical protein